MSIDISEDLINHAKENLKGSSSDLRFQVCDVKNYPFTKNEFDLVIGVEVLMHVKPKDINEVLENLIHTTKKHFVCVDFYQRPTPKLAPHNFVHDYESVFRTFTDLSRTNMLPIGNSQTLFQIEKTI